MSRRKKKNWKPLPDNIKEYNNSSGHFYYKEIRGIGFIRFHGQWWENAYQFKKRYPNIELPNEIETRLKILNVLMKYDLKY